MKTLTLHIPDNFDIDNNEFVMTAVSKMYEQGKLSLGQAAQLAGLTKRAFTELLSKYEVSIFNAPVSDLANDIANA
jgi:predicted HTH domain antitoxin